jgi:2-haloacid dehalogenase
LLDFNSFEVLTFDCYGTLIDWETGILGAMKPIAAKHNLDLTGDQLLEVYAELESELEAGEYISYRRILQQIMRSFADRSGFRLEHYEPNALVDSLENWPPFPDTVAALDRLKQKFRLAIISNIDDDLFAHSSELLKVDFDWVITAQQVGGYKPSLRNFQFAITKIGVSPDRILHVAQSIYHDIVPAKGLGLSTVWVNRRKGKEGFGATPKASETPDLEVPNLQGLADLIDNF